MSQVLDEPVPLSGDNKFGPIYLKPNANQVAVRLAAAAAHTRTEDHRFRQHQE
jgi:hypothetical protein